MGGGSRGREIRWETQFKAGCEDPGREDGKGLDMTSTFPTEAGRLGRRLGEGGRKQDISFGTQNLFLTLAKAAALSGFRETPAFLIATRIFAINGVYVKNLRGSLFPET